MAAVRSKGVYQLLTGNETTMNTYLNSLQLKLQNTLMVEKIIFSAPVEEGEEIFLSFLFREFQGSAKTKFRLSDLNVLFCPPFGPLLDKFRFRVGIGMSKLGLNEFSSILLGFSTSPWEAKLSRLRSSLVFHPVYMSVGMLVRSVNYLELKIEGFLLESGSTHQPCTSFTEIATSLQSLPLLQLSGLSAPREGSFLGHSPIAFTTLYSEVLTKLCDIYSHQPRQTQIASRDGKDRFRIGIAGGSFDGVHGRLIIGLLDSIPISLKSQIELFAICFPTAKSSVTDKVISLFDKHINVPDEIPLAIDRIRRANLHFLLFSDANYDTRVFALAHQRLTAIQGALWGWGGTTGVKSLDYFFIPEVLVNQAKCPPSPVHSRNIYPAACFKEQLVLLEGFPPLPRMAPISHEEMRHIMRSRYLLDVSNKTNIYLLPTSAKHLHPEYDKVIEVVLMTDPSAIFVVAVPKSARDNIPAIHNAVRHDLLHPSMPIAVVAKIKERLMKSLNENVDRVRFLPPLEEPLFRALQIRSNVVLDSFPVGLQLPILDAFWDNTPVLSAPFLHECVNSYAASIGHALQVSAYSEKLSGITLPKSAEEFGVLAVRIARDQILKRLFSLPQQASRYQTASSRSSHITQIMEFLRRKINSEN